jgi:two-component system nitrate/nitrite sensor histidine kinase NarX
LNNIAKHAQANNVEMSLNCQNGKVVLDIFDDGRGFNPGVVPSDHLGLNIMQERAQRIGAELDINSVLGEGTRVRVTWDGGEKKSGPR